MQNDFRNICRLCIQKCNGISFSIFPQSISSNKDISIPMRIASVIAIEINQNDGLPMKMCGQCRYRLELSYYFKRRSQIVDAKLRKHLTLLNHGKKSNVFLKDEEDDSDEMLEDSLRFLQSYEDERYNEYKNRASLELQKETQTQLKTLRSELTRNSNANLGTDVKNEVLQELEKVKQEIKHELENKYRKEEYKNIVNDMHEFLRMKQLQRKRHIKRTTKNLEVCEEIDNLDNIMSLNTGNELVTVPSEECMPDLLTAHLRNSSKQEENGNTVDSEVPITNLDHTGEEDDIEITVEDHSTVKRIECITVLNYSAEESVLKPHEVQHNMNKTLNVGNVGKANFKNLRYSEKYLKKRKNEVLDTNKSELIVTQMPKSDTMPLSAGRQTVTPKSFKCKFCPLTMSTKNSLERHLRVHLNGEKSVACPECKIVVSCRSALRRHMVLHSGQRPYVCGECNKAFAQREILKRHENTQHKGLRRHKCSYCDREFSQKINLTEHISRHHLGEGKVQRYKCHLCSKSFCHSSGLSRHLALHSGITYQCVQCVKCFSDRSSINRHILKIHGIEKTQELIIEIGQKNL